jgi:hypothetical protein
MVIPVATNIATNANPNKAPKPSQSTNAPPTDEAKMAIPTSVFAVPT